MPISGIGTRRPSHAAQQGLTLVELLVVIVILGLTAAAVAVTLPPRTSDVETHAKQLAAKLVSASEQAVFRGTVIGFDIDETSYGFRQYREEDWRGFAPRNPLSVVQLDDISLQFSIDDMPANEGVIGRDLGVSLDDFEEDETPPPVMLFSPTGDTSGVEVSLRDRNEVWIVAMSPLGKVEVRRD